MTATYQTPHSVHARGGGWASGPIVGAAAVATSAMFAGGGLLTQTVIVPFWRSGTPDQALERFSISGLQTGATLFPIELVSVVLLSIIAVSSIRRRRPGRLAWTLALACMVGTIVLLPVYFLPSNAVLLDRMVGGPDVDAALASWLAWNWLRTGLAVMAVIAGCLGLRADRIRR